MLNKDEFVVDVQPDGSASELPSTLQLDSGSPGITTVPIVIGGNVDKLSGDPLFGSWGSLQMCSAHCYHMSRQAMMYGQASR